MIGEEAVERVLSVLRDDISQMPKNWNRRFKHNRDKMKTGDIYELAEVVRNLAIRDFEKGLSTGEKQMFTRAKKILSSELMYALDMDEEEAEEYLDELLEETNQERAAAATLALSAARRRPRWLDGRRAGRGGRHRRAPRGRRPRRSSQLAGRPLVAWSPARRSPPPRRRRAAW